MRDTKDFNERFLRWKNGENYWEMRGVSLNTNSDRPATKELVELIKSRLAKFLDGKDNFESFYLLKMKEVGEQNYRVWGFNTPQEATHAALSDPTYDYRGFYEKYPESSANSNTHWPDEFKTVHHTTFSTESKYSGNKNKFNPQGLRGGFWNGDDFVPATWLEPKILNKRRKIMGYADGKDGDNPIVEKYKGTEHDLTKDAYKFTEPERFESLMNDWNLAENSDVANYFMSYVNSPGFDRIRNNQKAWWHKRHPIRSYFPDFMVYPDSAKDLKDNVNKYGKDVLVFPMDMYGELSFYSPFTGNAYVGTRDGFGTYYDEAAAHEYAHGVQGFTPYKGVQYEALEQNKNTALSDSDAANRHDADSREKHSDMWGLKYLLYTNGIYDSRSKKDITPKQVKKLREKYPDFRPLKQMNDVETAWMLNHVAANTVSNSNYYDYGYMNGSEGISYFSGGKDVQYTRQNGNPIAFDEQGNLIDQVTGLTGVMLDEVFNRMAVTPQGVTFNGVVPNSSGDKPKELVYLNPMDYVNILTAGGLNNLSPSQWIRRAYDAATGNLTFDNWIYGNNGVVSDNFAKNNPLLSTGINFAIDFALYNPTSIYRLGKRINDSKFADRLRGYKYFEDVYHGSPIEFDIENARTLGKSGYDTGLHVANNEDTPTFFGNRIAGGAKYKGRLRLKDRPVDIPDMGRWDPGNFAYEAENNPEFAEYLTRHGIDWKNLRTKYTGYISENGFPMRGSSEQQMKDFSEMLRDKNIALRYINNVESSYAALPEYRSYYLSNPKQVKWSKMRVYGNGIPEQYKLIINPIDEIRAQWWKFADDPNSYYFNMNSDINPTFIPPLHINDNKQYSRGKKHL